MRKIKTTVALALALLLTLPGAHAADRVWIPYKKLIDTLKLDKFYGLPAAERDKLILYARLVPVNKSIAPPDVKLTVVDGASRTALPLDAAGRTLVVPNARWLGDDATIWTSLPTGEKMSMSFDLGAVLPESVQWNYAAVMGSIPQANGAIGKVAGAFSLFLPTMKSVIFKFDKPAQLTIEAKDGAQHYVSDAKNYVRLKLDAALLKENPLVILSDRPHEAEIDSD
jgi:hypothetical protein